MPTYPSRERPAPIEVMPVTDEAVPPLDREALALERWDRWMRARLRPLLTKRLIAEHRRNPLGDHGDALKRVLNYMRRSPLMPPYVILCTEPFRCWRIVRLAGGRGNPPIFADEREFDSEAKAIHALFLLRIDEMAHD